MTHKYHWLDGFLEPTIRVQLDGDAKPPMRFHPTDAGADICTPESFVLVGNGFRKVHTGVHVELPPNTACIVMSRSSLYVNHGIITTGLVDEGYDGEIVVRLTNTTRHPRAFEKGDRIAQLLVIPVLYPYFMKVDAIRGGERGSSGFGSSGR